MGSVVARPGSLVYSCTHDVWQRRLLDSRSGSIPNRAAAIATRPGPKPARETFIATCETIVPARETFIATRETIVAEHEAFVLGCVGTLPGDVASVLSGQSIVATRQPLVATGLAIEVDDDIQHGQRHTLEPAHSGCGPCGPGSEPRRESIVPWPRSFDPCRESIAP